MYLLCNFTSVKDIEMINKIFAYLELPSTLNQKTDNKDTLGISKYYRIEVN